MADYWATHIALALAPPGVGYGFLLGIAMDRVRVSINAGLKIPYPAKTTPPAEAGHPHSDLRY